MTEPTTPATPIPDDTLARWRKLAEEATGGPWEFDQGFGGVWAPRHGAALRLIGRTGSDGHFIAEARSALPALLDEVERLKDARLAEAAADAVTILELRAQNRRLEEELQKVRDAIRLLQDHIDDATAP